MTRSEAALVKQYGHTIARKAIQAARDKRLRLWLDDNQPMTDEGEARYAGAVARNLAQRKAASRPVVRI
ncbi:MAG: hypothetical protein LAO78_23775 [Acidobacteriia bacterium]|nr:hypothetical protein [Terriglobia bacterium]